MTKWGTGLQPTKRVKVSNTHYVYYSMHIPFNISCHRYWALHGTPHHVVFVVVMSVVVAVLIQAVYDAMFKVVSMKVCVSEINCTHPHELPNMSLKFNMTTFGHTAKYTCHNGFRFPNGDRMAEVSCSDTGNWTAANGTCEGGFMHAADRHSCARTHARIHVRTHAHKHERTHEHTHTRTHARTQTRTYARARARTHTHVHSHISPNINYKHTCNNTNLHADHSISYML